MPKDKDYQLFFRSNEDDSATSLLYLHGDNIEDCDKKYMVTKI